MGLAESLTLYHQAPNVVQIKESEIHVKELDLDKEVRVS